MRVIIAGSRTMSGVEEAINRGMSKAMAAGITPTLIRCGCADGGDLAGFKWARDNGVKVEFHPAWHHQEEWARQRAWPDEIIHPLPRQGRQSGRVRNCQMSLESDVLVAAWDGSSSGTKNMIDHAEAMGLLVFKEGVIDA